MTREARRRWRGILVGLFAAVCLAAAGSAGSVPGTVVWAFPTGGFVHSSPVVGEDGTVYVGSSDWSVYALGPDGSLRWSYKTGGEVLSSPAVGDDGTVYVGAVDGQLYALRPDGTLKWSYETAGQVYGSPLVAGDGSVCFGSRDDAVYALAPDGSLRWRFVTGGDVTGCPAEGEDGTLRIGSLDGVLYALNPDGTVKWRFAAGGPVFSSPVVGGDGRVYFGCLDGVLYALDPSGTLLWTYEAGGEIYGSPALDADGVVYFGATDGVLHAVLPSGLPRWTLPVEGGVMTSPAISADGSLYVGADDGRLYAVSSGGTLLWRFEAPKSIRSSPALHATGAVLFGADDGSVYAILTDSDAASAPWPLFQGGRRHLGRVAAGALQSEAPARRDIELAHDDGTSEASRGLVSAGMGFAVRFSPPAAGAVLRAARFYFPSFRSGPGPIEIHVWGADKRDLISPREVVPESPGWYEADLSSEGLVLAGEFYVGYLQQSADLHPWVGLDTAGSGDSSLVVPDWTPVLPGGSNLMIRALIRTPIAPSGEEREGETEISYDDGSAESGCGFAIPGAGYAVRFTPPPGARLERARVYVTGFRGDPAPIEIRIWDKDQRELVPALRATPSSVGWLDVDLSGYGLEPAEDFYVGYTQTDGENYPWVGRDETTPQGRSYSVSSQWAELTTRDNVMIRVVVKSK